MDDARAVGDAAALRYAECAARNEPDQGAASMSIGPVEYAVLSFPGNRFNGDVAPALANLIESGTIRLLDLIFVGKSADGDVVVVEFDEMEELAAFGDLEGEVGGIVSPDDIAYVASGLAPNSSAALLIWEDVWATEFATAVRQSGGELVESARVPFELVEALFADLP
jgi:hypothetical protein